MFPGFANGLGESEKKKKRKLIRVDINCFVQVIFRLIGDISNVSGVLRGTEFILQIDGGHGTAIRSLQTLKSSRSDQKKNET